MANRYAIPASYRILVEGKSVRRKPIPEYQAWIDMRTRCYRKTFKGHRHWGGRGITVCDRWLGKDGFRNFFADLGPRPGPGFSLDRYPNQDGNYEPGNVRWASTVEQAVNRSNSTWIEIEGISMVASHWAGVMGMPVDVLWRRRNVQHLSDEVAIMTPYRPRNKSRPLNNPREILDRLKSDKALRTASTEQMSFARREAA